MNQIKISFSTPLLRKEVVKGVAFSDSILKQLEDQLPLTPIRDSTGKTIGTVQNFDSVSKLIIAKIDESHASQLANLSPDPQWRITHTGTESRIIGISEVIADFIELKTFSPFLGVVTQLGESDNAETNNFKATPTQIEQLEAILLELDLGKNFTFERGKKVF